MNMQENKRVNDGRKNEEEAFVKKMQELVAALKQRHGKLLDDAEKKEYFAMLEKCGHQMDNMYRTALARDMMEHILHYNRILHSTVKAMDSFAVAQEDSYLYAMGVVNGTYRAYVQMTARYNEEELFARKMADVIKREHYRDVLIYLYDHENIRHRLVCDAVGVSPSHLNRMMNVLSDVNCVCKISSGKYSNYHLTQYGKRYVKVTLGYRGKEIVDTDYRGLTGVKPRLNEGEPFFDLMFTEDDAARLVEVKYQNIG